MMSFITDELVWAIRREREEEVRNTRPHTTPRPDPERAAYAPEPRSPLPLWIAPSLRIRGAGAK